MRNPLLVVLLAAGVGACSSGAESRGPEWIEPVPFATPGPSAASSPGEACSPTAGGPYWALEGEPVSFDIACATGAAGQFQIDSLPAGASFDGAHFSWTPALDQAAVYHLIVHDSISGESAQLKIGIADDFLNSHNVLVKDPAKYEEEYGVPVIFLNPAPTSFDVARTTTVVYGGHTYTALGKKRGHTSISYPKNSYVLEFATTDKFTDYAHFSHKKRRIAVTNTFDDNSLLRNRMAYTLWAKMDPGHVKLQAYDAVVYLNGKFWGVYTISDRVDHNLMQDEGLAEGGNLFEAEDHTADWTLVDGTAGTKSSAHEGFVKKDGTPPAGQPGAWTDLDEAVTWVATTTNQDFGANAAKRFDLRDYEDWWIFVTFMDAEDNAAKNSFHYHDVAAGGPFRYVPWDFNATFGQNWQTLRRDSTSYNDFGYANHLFERILGSSVLRNETKARYRQTLDGPWSKAALEEMLDGFAKEIAPVAHRDEKKWGATYRSYPAWSSRTDFTTWDEEIDYMRRWIDRRWDYTSTHFAAH